MYYPMHKHGIYQVCIRRTPLSVLGKSGLGHKQLFRLGCPSPYAILKNIIIRSKYCPSARHIMFQRYLLYREHSHRLNLSKSYIKNGVFMFPFANPFCGLFCNFFFGTIYQNTIACNLRRSFMQ